MTLAFSLYLDVVRFLAAAGVFLAHLTREPFTSNILKIDPAYAQFSVMAFFVLSGYVIAHVTSTKETSLLVYAGSRLSRLYSVVILALLLTYTLDTLGAYINPNFYAIKGVLYKPPSWEGYVSSFFFVNEYQVFGFRGIAPGTNGPFWSLSFEVAYYVIAGLVLFSRPKIYLPVSFCILFMAGRTITALLPVWLLGFFLYRYRDEIKLSFWPSLSLFFI